LTNDQRVLLIRRHLTAALEPNDLAISDDSHLHAGHEGAREGKGHFSVQITSSHFEGLNPIKRHRLIYEALGTLMETDIHALSIDARTPDQ
jgi:BolA protein